jgi:hypothetical protein
MRSTTLLTGMVLISLWRPVFASEAVDTLLDEYRSEGVTEFSLEAGKVMWTQEFTDAETGKIRQCSTCHTADLTQEGKHEKTGKVIKPLAPSVNPERLTLIAEINKWFKRNCKWTIGRECTPQEKGDFLIYINAQ